MKKYIILIMTAVLLSFSDIQPVSAGEIMYSEIKDNTINVFTELPDSTVNEKQLLIDGEAVKISSFSDSPAVNTVFLTDCSVISGENHEKYCRVIRNILETDGENDKFSFISFDDEEIIKDSDFTGKQLDILNAAEKLTFADSSMPLNQPVSYAENMFENTDESFCRIILFTNTANLESFSSFEKYKYPVFAVLTDDSEAALAADFSKLKNSVSVFRYCRCTGKFDPDSISDFIANSSRVCRLEAAIPEKFLDYDSERTVVLEFSSEDAEYSFSQKVEIPSYINNKSTGRKNRTVLISALTVFIILMLVSFAAAASVRKKKKADHKTSSNTLNVTGTAVIPPEKVKGTLVSDAGTKMLFEDTGEYRIVLSGKGENTRNIVLISSRETVIGRNQYQADEVIYDERSISQKHCRIYTRENRVFVEDLNSLNHTFVNGEEIKDETEIKTGSVLKIGRIEFDVQIIFGR